MYSIQTYICVKCSVLYVGHSLSYIGDVTKVDLERSFIDKQMPVGLYGGGQLVCGANGEVRVTHKKPNRATVGIEGALADDG